MTTEDRELATAVGNRRADQHGYGHADHIVGAMAEVALCRFLGGPVLATWTADHAFRIDFKSIRSDVPPFYQVRATTNPHGSLIFTEGKDDPTQVYVLAIVTAADVRLIGWQHGFLIAADESARHLRDERSRRRGRPLDCTHMVLQRDLNPMETLPR